MAASIGVRSCRASTPVPRSRPGTAAATAPREAKASGPTVSAVQNEPKPAARADRAMSSPTSRPRAWKLAKVSPIGRSVLSMAGNATRRVDLPGPARDPFPVGCHTTPGSVKTA